MLKNKCKRKQKKHVYLGKCINQELFQLWKQSPDEIVTWNNRCYFIGQFCDGTFRIVRMKEREQRLKWRKSKSKI